MTWLATLFTSIFTAVGDFFRGRFRDKDAISNAEEKGRSEAEAEGLRQVNEISDRQTKRATDDLSEDDVLRRLDGGTG